MKYIKNIKINAFFHLTSVYFLLRPIELIAISFMKKKSVFKMQLNPKGQCSR